MTINTIQNDAQYQVFLAVKRANPTWGRRRICHATGFSKHTVSRFLSIAKSVHPSNAVKPVDPTDARVMHLERQLQRCQDDANALHAKLKSANREESIFQSLAEEIKDHAPVFPALPKAPIKPKADKVIHEDLVLHISDEHADQIVKKHQVDGLEEYNFNVALARAEMLIEKVIDFSQSTLSNYKFDTLWMLCYGDHCNGEIHGGINHSYYRNAIRNALAIGKMHSLMLRDLAAYFDNINVVYVPGNHGRKSLKKDYNAPWDNWDYLVAETCKQCSSDLNVSFLIPEAYSINLDIKGYTFNVSHGDDIKSWNSVPYYGIERQTRRLIGLHAAVDKKVDYFVRGHFHNQSTLSQPCGETLLNGTWKATDPFAYNSLGAYVNPTQLLHGVHHEHGVTWRLPVDIKFDGDTDGPERYKVDITSPEDAYVQTTT